MREDVNTEEVVEEQGSEDEIGDTCCRAGWLAVHTTVLYSQFDSLTLGPHFPYCYPPGLLCYHWVQHTVIGPGALLSGWSHYYWVRHAIIGLGALLSGQLHYYQAYLVHFPFPAFILLLCTLFPTTPCGDLAFTYMLPYLSSVIVTLGACP